MKDQKEPPITMFSEKDLFITRQSPRSTSKRPVNDRTYAGPVNCIIHHDKGSYFGYYDDGQLDYTENPFNYRDVKVTDKDWTLE